MNKSSVLFLSATLALGVLFGLVTALPHIEQRLETEMPFKGIEIMANDAETHYVARYREVLDGHWMLGNVYYHAPKDQLYLLPPLPELAYTSVARFLPVDRITAFVLITVISAILTVLAAVAMMAALTGRKWEALTAVSVMLFAGVVFAAPWDVPRALMSHSFSMFSWLRFTRTVNPLWSGPWTFLTIWLIAKWFKSGSLKPLLFAAVTTAILLYSYFYAWTFIGAGLLFLSLWLLVKGDWKRLSHLVFFVFVFAVLGSVYFLHLHELMRHPWYLETAHRQGVVLSHAPVIGAWMLAFVCIAFAGIRVWKEAPLVCSLALGGALAINQSVFTGQHLFPEHYHWYYLQPYGTLFLVALVLIVLKKYIPRVQPYLMIACVLVSIAFGFTQQAAAYQTYHLSWGKAQELAPVFAFITKRLPPSGTVYADNSWLTDLIPVYTSLDVYTSSNAMNYLAPTERTRDTYFFALWMKGVTPARIAKEFYTTRRSEMGSAIYASYYRELSGDYGAMPDSLIADHIKAYEAYYDWPTARKINLYPLDYIIVSPNEVQSEEMKALVSHGKKVYDANGYKIIELEKMVTLG